MGMFKGDDIVFYTCRNWKKLYDRFVLNSLVNIIRKEEKLIGVYTLSWKAFSRKMVSRFSASSFTLAVYPSTMVKYLGQLGIESWYHYM